MERRDFAARLIAAMDTRIGDAPALRQQHEVWRKELEEHFRETEPDIPWDETEAALREIARARGVALPDG